MQRKDDEDPVLTGVAAAIHEGTPVDWQQQTTSHGELKEKLAHLRLIEEVASAHARVSAGAPANARPSLATAPASPALASWGPLRIIEPLGSGGFGEVFRAYDPSLRREVALKLRSANRPGADRPAAGRQGDDPGDDRFLEEARQLARIRHPGVLVVHGADRHEGRAGLWTDLLRGKTLEEVLAAQGPFGAPEAAMVGIDLCHALAAVHSAGLVHRDVKAANVMREQGGRIVLMDFGSVTARPAHGAPATSSEPISGTPLYMAPEQILQSEAATPSSDIYALGVLLYHLVSGRFPVEGQTWADLHDRHLHGRRTALRDARPDLPAAFVRVVGRALDPDPSQRFASAGEMEESLAAAIGTVRPGQSSVLPEKGREWHRRPVLVASLAAAAFVVVAAGVALAPRVIPALFSSGPLKVEATLYRQEADSDVRLLSGSRLRPGDRLLMEIESGEAVYAYVINEDANGESYALFPAGLDLRNPLLPGVKHRLPGSQAGKQITWQVTSAGGRERFLLIASRQPLKDLERDIARMPRAESGRQVASQPLGPRAFETLRGAGGLTEGFRRPDDGTGGRLSEIVRGLDAGAQARHGFWIWQIELENPAP